MFNLDCKICSDSAVTKGMLFNGPRVVLITFFSFIPCSNFRHPEKENGFLLYYSKLTNAASDKIKFEIKVEICIVLGQFR